MKLAERQMPSFMIQVAAVEAQWCKCLSNTAIRDGSVPVSNCFVCVFSDVSITLNKNVSSATLILLMKLTQLTILHKISSYQQGNLDMKGLNK